MPDVIRYIPSCRHCGADQTPVYGNHRRKPWWFCIPCEKGDPRAAELLGYNFKVKRLSGRLE